MKNLNKISILLILLLGLTFTSCETTDLDLINDPNQITVDNGNLDRYMVAIQIDFARFATYQNCLGLSLDFPGPIGFVAATPRAALVKRDINPAKTDL